MAWTSEQLSAIELDKTNIIVSAGAGSGKTEVLSERVISKIKKGIHVNELLILTFTNAAASEMKDRIRQKIMNNPDYLDEINLLESAYITTFDSYALSIVNKYHYLLNIPSNISITDESIVKIIEGKIIDEVFNEFYLKNDDGFNNLIKKYCIKNDKLIKNNILNIANSINAFINSKEYIANIRNNFFKKENINKIVNEYKEFIESKRSFSKKILTNLYDLFDYEFAEKLRTASEEILNCDINQIKNISFSLPRIPSNTSKEAKEEKSFYKSSLDDILVCAKNASEEDIIKEIITSKDSILVILDLVETYIKKLTEYKKQNNILTFKDIAFSAIDIVSEFEDVRNEIKYSFKEIMIDEYQDTNNIQEKFISYIENNNVYMVGDIKQSIYRFNGSNPNIFKSKYDNFSNNINGKKIDLIKNFRSRDEVLLGINNLFRLVMDNEIGGANYKESHEMVYGNADYDEKKDNISYNMEILEYEESNDLNNTQIEILSIANDIKNKISSGIKVYDKKKKELRKSKYSDFVIILDRSKYFEEYKKTFESLGIPLTILKDDKLNASVDINLIKNIIDFILRINNNDFGIEFKYDFTSIARSFLYQFSDDEIYDCFINDNFKDNIIYKDFASIESINSKTCSQLFEEILDITDFYNKINRIGDYENINVRLSSIYQISNNINDLGYSIEEFKEYLENILSNGIEITYEAFQGGEDSVKIMTIHKSKGLEYPICYFADLNHKFNLQDLKEKFIVTDNYGILLPSSIDEKDTSVMKYLYTQSYMNDEISERIRLFYVALTRAREKTIIIVPEKETYKKSLDEKGVIDYEIRTKINKLSDIIYLTKDYLKDYLDTIDLNKLKVNAQTLGNTYLDLDNAKEFDVEEIKIDNSNVSHEHYSKEANKLLTKNQILNMETGIKIHEVLEYIDLKNYDESLIDDEYIRNKVTAFVNNKILENCSRANIYHEYEFNYQDKDIEYNGVIDLMLEYEDYIDIIDYKLKKVNDSKYLDQLNGYKKYIEKISNKDVNIYLYSIIEEKIEKLN